ncbi:Uma2 family endonuclease [Crossiella equi]|uniref:Uma2 family endonuclease n=1 Tax=Crossiella equi TaxID=130796 RepID=A0ABS5AHY5_9PSEU|nr:Uma2 family endonuclease [Crossiella equi]MBP2475839.1 Uma2 family endonuclease [Crossiella equi]
MTAETSAVPSELDGLLTAADYRALPEFSDDRKRELQEGFLVMSPSPKARHAWAIRELLKLLDQQLPTGLTTLSDVDVDLELVGPDEPGTVRRPDVVVVPLEAYDAVEADDRLFRAAEVVLAIEVISPGSNRVDRVMKASEYADAGIGHYWVLDLGSRPGATRQLPVSLVVHHLAEEFGYVSDEVTGQFETTAPFPFTVDLSSLRR